jgi:hypothetical protein
MIYPFTLKKIESRLEGTFDVWVERQNVLNYSDPANQEALFMAPTVIKFDEFYHVTAATEEDALLEVAKIVNAIPTKPTFEFDFSKVQINVVNN